MNDLSGIEVPGKLKNTIILGDLFMSTWYTRFVECKKDYTAVVINYERVCILCSINNPLCFTDTNPSNESNADTSTEGSANNSNSPENSENSDESESLSSTRLKKNPIYLIFYLYPKLLLHV
jgi:hypothetical protein